MALGEKLNDDPVIGRAQRLVAVVIMACFAAIVVAGTVALIGAIT